MIAACVIAVRVTGRGLRSWSVVGWAGAAVGARRGGTERGRWVRWCSALIFGTSTAVICCAVCWKDPGLDGLVT